MANKSDIGLIGLAVMGENLVLNMESKGFTVSVFNRTLARVDNFIAGRAAGKNIVGTHSLEELVSTLKSPRKVFLMIKAGAAVDEYIDKLIPLLEPGDVIIDGGNTHFPDTARRREYVEGRGLLYIGTGVSGGEEGALKGPSMMPGGSPKAWPLVKPIFQSICAHVADGSPCCDWVGEGGAGHFVKMVHNGIEYGDIQLICECYQIMKDCLGMSNSEMSEVFGEWNLGDLDSYLIEITRDILAKKDDDGHCVLDYILDTAGQKGTGKWTAIAALDAGVPLTLITESVYARSLSAQKEERVAASKILAGPCAKCFEGNREEFLSNLQQALFASKVVSYAQGFALMRAAAAEYGWRLNYGNIALMWRGGCIIRSVFLGKIKEAFDSQPDLANIMLAPYFQEKMAQAQSGWRRVIALAVENGIPTPTLSAALSYYDGYRSGRLPANLLQAMRDYFGAHTYERTDRPRGEFFHTNWTGFGGDTTSSTYNA
ncbi:MAG: decarboxylating NADP(+)-dependent phosphogluconate dehydrogenase [Bacteroidales bacterium]|nr:decarboxylating NADP(+)-dependent phosphogluconate dehydrogenase [Bacteroidales bacterium]